MEHHYTDGTEPTVMPHMHCHGPCEQGRKPCPAPHACERVDTDGDGLEVLGGAAIVVIVLFVAVMLLT